MITNIWLNDPKILLRNDKLTEIWPTKNMNSSEKINAITRLIIILVIICYILTNKISIICIGIITILLVIIVYYLQNNYTGNNYENFSNKLPGVYSSLSNPKIYEMNKADYQQPEKKNPLMNTTLPEIYYKPNRKPAAPSFMPTVETKINNLVKDIACDSFDDPKIKNKLFANLGDEFVLNRSMLQYNSMPNTQIPSDFKKYKEYLYGDMISAKEGNPIALERNHAGSYNFTNP